jgi:hypothetical protein
MEAESEGLRPPCYPVHTGRDALAANCPGSTAVPSAAALREQSGGALRRGGEFLVTSWTVSSWADFPARP